MTEMKKAVIIGANEFQDPLIRKAKELGYETHVFAWAAGAVGEKTADYFYPISITEKEQILAECRHIQPDLVASVGSDLAVPTVIYLQHRLGMKGNSERSAQISTNKYEMRRALAAAGLSVPRFVKVTGEEKEGFAAVQREKLGLPVIVKPTDRSGSRAIQKLTDWDGLAEALQKAQEASFEQAAIVEEYLEGEEFSCESISWEGKHHCLAITKKYTTGAPHYIETGHMEPAQLPEAMYTKVYDYIRKALDALEIRYGASHAEFKLDADGEVHIIEIGARMGGDCIGSHLVQLSTGYDFLKMVLDVAAGKEPKLEKTAEPGIACIQFIFSAEDLRRYQKLQKEHGDKIQYVSPIHVDEKAAVTDSSSRYGYYIMRFDSVKEAKELWEH